MVLFLQRSYNPNICFLHLFDKILLIFEKRPGYKTEKPDSHLNYRSRINRIAFLSCIVFFVLSQPEVIE